MELSSKIESLLFFKSEPVTVRWLADALQVSEGDIWSGLSRLEGELSGRGICLIRKDDTVVLATDPSMSGVLERITKEELEKDLGKAALETLTIVLYKGPVSKSHIDYIRGVNSSFILRNLLVRGLVERKTNPDDERIYIYSPTLDLLSYMGLSKREDLPHYEEVIRELQKFEEAFGRDTTRHTKEAVLPADDVGDERDGEESSEKTHA